MNNFRELEVSDFEIIYKIFNGEKDKFAIIIKKYQSYIFSIVLKFVSNLEDAKDLAQEIFVKIYYSLPQYNIKYNFKNWIYKIAINYMLDFVRRRNSKKNFLNIDFVSLENISPKEQNLEYIELKEEIQKILTVVDRLKPKYKEVIFLKYVEGLGIKDISDILKITPQNVKIRLHRAIKMIKNFLKFL